jgi:hypothetical protein
MLIVAAAATAEIRTRRRNPVGRGYDDLLCACAGEARFFLGKRRFNFLSGKYEWNKHGFAAFVLGGIDVVDWNASEAVAAIDELFNVKEQDLILRHGLGGKIGRFDLSCPTDRNFRIANLSSTTLAACIHFFMLIEKAAYRFKDTLQFFWIRFLLGHILQRLPPRWFIKQSHDIASAED